MTTDPLLWGAAAFLAALVECCAFNGLSVIRARAHAAQTAPLDERLPELWRRGLGAMLVVTTLKRGSSFGGWAALCQLGLPSSLAGAAMGVFDGVLFMPFRRVLVAQQGFSQPESALDIWRRLARFRGPWALWEGGTIGGLRGLVGGLVYFGAVGAMMRHWPALGDVQRGFVAAVATTIVCNPLEVLISAMVAPLPLSVRPAELMRGTLQALARTLPAATLGYWMTCRIAAALQAWLA